VAATVSIVFEAHSTTLDIEAGLAAGHYDVALSARGEEQARDHGESYEQTTQRMGEFLHDLTSNYSGKRVMIIDHRATQYGLEHHINSVPLAKILTNSWQWRPGWDYQLDKIV